MRLVLLTMSVLIGSCTGSKDSDEAQLGGACFNTATPLPSEIKPVDLKLADLRVAKYEVNGLQEVEMSVFAAEGTPSPDIYYWQACANPDETSCENGLSYEPKMYTSSLTPGLKSFRVYACVTEDLVQEGAEIPNPVILSSAVTIACGAPATAKFEVGGNAEHAQAIWEFENIDARIDIKILEIYMEVQSRAEPDLARHLLGEFSEKDLRFINAVARKMKIDRPRRYTERIRRDHVEYRENLEVGLLEEIDTLIFYTWHGDDLCIHEPVPADDANASDEELELGLTDSDGAVAAVQPLIRPGLGQNAQPRETGPQLGTDGANPNELVAARRATQAGALIAVRAIDLGSVPAYAVNDLEAAENALKDFNKARAGLTRGELDRVNNIVARELGFVSGKTTADEIADLTPDQKAVANHTRRFMRDVAADPKNPTLRMNFLEKRNLVDVAATRSQFNVELMTRFRDLAGRARTLSRERMARYSFTDLDFDVDRLSANDLDNQFFDNLKAKLGPERAKFVDDFAAAYRGRDEEQITKARGILEVEIRQAQQQYRNLEDLLVQDGLEQGKSVDQARAAAKSEASRIVEAQRLKPSTPRVPPTGGGSRIFGGVVPPCLGLTAGNIGRAFDAAANTAAARSAANAASAARNAGMAKAAAAADAAARRAASVLCLTSDNDDVPLTTYSNELYELLNEKVASFPFLQNVVFSKIAP